jgi:hypothetical protein
MKLLHGYIYLIGLILFTGSELAIAAPVRFEWILPPENVTLSHLRLLLPDGSSTYLADSTTNTTTVELPAGTYRVVVTCQNAHGWSSFSDPVEVVVPDTPPKPPSKPTGLRVVRVFTSSTPDGPKTLNGHYVVNPEPDGTYPPKQFITTEAILVPKP